MQNVLVTCKGERGAYTSTIVRNLGQKIQDGGNLSAWPLEVGSIDQVGHRNRHFRTRSMVSWQNL
jgi:hypothetical protein